MAERLRYDKTLLEFIVSRDTITLVGEYSDLRAKSRIKFICPCSNQAEKDMRSIYEHTAKCKDCTTKIKVEKIVTKISKSGGMDQPTRNIYIVNTLKEKFPTSDYDYSKVMWDGIQASKITLVCNTHTLEWTPIVANMLQHGSGCPKCGREIGAEKQRKDFIGESIKKFGEDRFDYSKVMYEHAHQEITLTCRKHNEEFTYIAREHLNRICGGCPSCDKENSSGINHCSAISLDELKTRIQEKWGDKYTYDFTGYTHLNSKINIRCSIHNITWLCTGANHIHDANPRGCRICGNEEIGNKLRMPVEDCLKRFREVHDNLYTYENVIYKNNATNVLVTCKTHGDFPISPASHWAGFGCQMCSLAGVSKVQLEWLKHIETTTGNDIIYKGGKHKREEIFKFNSNRYRIDGYCKDTKTIYEFNGCWFHGCPDCQDPEKIYCWSKKKEKETMKDLLQTFVEKKKVFEENGYTVVYIWECKWKEHKKSIALCDKDVVDGTISLLSHV